MSSLSLLTVHAWPTSALSRRKSRICGVFLCFSPLLLLLFVCLFIFFVLSLLAGNISFMAKHFPIFYNLS